MTRTKAVDIERSWAPYRSAMPYLSELTEVRRLLERSACHRWWEFVSLEIFGQTPSWSPSPQNPGSLFPWNGECLACEPRMTWPTPSVPSPVPPRVELVLEYARCPIGVLHLRWRSFDAPGVGAVHESALKDLAFQCARLVQRMDSQRWVVLEQLGAPCLIGSSPVMLDLDRQIEESCADDRPVLLLGSSANEALQTAAAIHHGSRRKGQPFVRIDCATTLESPWRWVERARGGTLVLCHTDSGTPVEQEHLWQQLDHALGHTAEPGYHRACRLVVAMAARPVAEASDARLPSEVWRPGDWKAITLPSLSQHAEDIPLLIRAVLDYHGHGAEQRVTDALQHWCTHYTWPGHAAQLEWTVARMAVLTAAPIGASDISLLSPRLLGDTAMAFASESPDASCQDCRDEALGPVSASPTVLTYPVEHWVRCVLDQDTQALSTLHAGLARALMYLCKQFHEPISAEQLAQKAHVSASHLRFLFRDSLGLSFKLFLQHVRIAHAKRLLMESPRRRITDVALSVGFSDFSHFQKCFRMIVGQTPGGLRRTRTSTPDTTREVSC